MGGMGERLCAIAGFLTDEDVFLYGFSIFLWDYSVLPSGKDKRKSR